MRTGQVRTIKTSELEALKLAKHRTKAGTFRTVFRVQQYPKLPFFLRIYAALR